MASIFKRGNTYYIDYIDNTGKRIRKSLGTSNKKLAEIKRAEIETELAKGRLGFATDIELSEFIKKYLEYSRVNKSKETYNADKKALEDLITYIGNINLSQITIEKLEGWKMWLIEARNLSKTSANIKIRHVKSAFSKALEWKYLESNPAQKLKQFKTPIGRPDFLTEEQFQKFLSHVDNQTHKAVFILLYLTGMRLSEVANLTWDDVNFEEMTITIRSKKDWHTKNYKERVIPIHSKLLPFLEHLKSESPNKVIPYAKRTIEDIFSKYSKLSGIKITPHLLRHSIATAMASKGVSLQAIKEILGHSDYSTTLIYAKLVDDYKRKALESVNIELKTNKLEDID